MNIQRINQHTSRNIYERGVDDRGFGRIRSKGDTALFGGHTTEDRNFVLASSQHARWQIFFLL